MSTYAGRITGPTVRFCDHVHDSIAEAFRCAKQQADPGTTVDVVRIQEFADGTEEWAELTDAESEELDRLRGGPR